MIDQVEQAIKDYPDAFALAVGCLLSWPPGLVLETWFLPEAWPARKVKQVTLSVTMLIAFIVSAAIWHSVDRTDSEGLVGLVSFVAALGAPFVHVAAATVLTHFFPYLDSVFHFKVRNDPVA